ncbi:MAG: uroporphyrinogen decarboxylase, partial [Ignavibacteria bacterium]|nr:uroporphyrinogen decarboxylase [Ignavibacteria bacterium]
ASYLSAKIEAGVDAVQIFDTWAGNLTEDDFLEFSLPYITKTVELIKREKQPVIVFPKGANHSLKKIAKCGADVVGVDWGVTMEYAREKIGKHAAVQGNLDPTILYAPEEKIKTETVKILEVFGNHPGHIFNLGHGILPDVQPAKAKFLVKTVHEESTRLRSELKKKKK